MGTVLMVIFTANLIAAIILLILRIDEWLNSLKY